MGKKKEMINNLLSMVEDLDSRVCELEELLEGAEKIEDSCKCSKEVAPPPSSLQVNWDEINSKFMWVAEDVDGSVWAFETRPEIVGTGWRLSLRNHKSAFKKLLDSSKYNYSSTTWKESLRKRPI